MRDQGGTCGGMYYRQFRCKGKSKGNCSVAYTHEDFLSLVTRQLGKPIIEEVKRKINFNLDDTPGPSTLKRQHDTVSTGMTPKGKRFQSTSATSDPPPSFSMESLRISPDTLESRQMEDMRHRVERAESMNEFHLQSIKQKDELISILRERIKLLHEKKTTVENIDSPPDFPDLEDLFVIPPVTLSPPPQVLATPDIPHSPEIIPDSDPIQTYSEAIRSPAKSPLPMLQREPVPDGREKLQKKHQLTLVYLLGMQYKTVGEFRKDVRDQGLSLYGVRNVSFIGSSIVELLVEESSVQAFMDKAKETGFKVTVDLDVTKKTKDNPVWIEYNDPRSSLHETIKSNFIRRISHEISSSSDDRVRQFYLEWTKYIGWEKSLLLSTTSLSS